MQYKIFYLEKNMTSINLFLSHSLSKKGIKKRTPKMTFLIVEKRVNVLIGIGSCLVAIKDTNTKLL
ncbi:hypothetical protein VF14_16520 [Nostoc linckia z18]|nr:hypothetical protein VF14_16520 [Nostoc linckia z18]